MWFFPTQREIRERPCERKIQRQIQREKNLVIEIDPATYHRPRPGPPAV